MATSPRLPSSGVGSERPAPVVAAGPAAPARGGTVLALCAWCCLQVATATIAAQVPVPPPPQRPAVPTAPAAGETPVDDAVKEALQQYSAALESLDADQVKKVHPSVDSEGLKRAFREMRELKVAIDTVKVLSIDGATARISCRVTQTLTPRSGSKQSNTVTRVLRLRRQETAWLIDGFER